MLWKLLRRSKFTYEIDTDGHARPCFFIKHDKKEELTHNDESALLSLLFT